MRILLCLLAAMTAGPVVSEKGTEIFVRNQHYVARIDKNAGGMLAVLASPDEKKVFVAGHNIYSDYGLFKKRGAVGTREEHHPKVKVRRGAGFVEIVSTGKLQGKARDPDKYLYYRVVYRLDRTPCVHVRCEVTPSFSEKEVHAFLATCFHVPSAKEWLVRTADGLMRGVVGADVGRSFRSARYPLDLKKPLISFFTGRDRISVTGFGRADLYDLQNIVIHGNTLFFAWLDGQSTPLEKRPLRVSFKITVPSRPR